VLFTSADGQTRVECRFESDTLWLSQAAMAELYDKDVRTINEHLINLYSEEELVQNATIRKFRIVRLEGTRQVSREIDHYNFEAILAVGYRVRSQRGTQFRQWATQVLKEYLIKGFKKTPYDLANSSFLKRRGKSWCAHKLLLCLQYSSDLSMGMEPHALYSFTYQYRN